MVTYISGPRSVAIASSGLSQWHPDAASTGEAVVATILDLLNTGNYGKQKLRININDFEDERWTEALTQTVVFSIFAESQRASWHGAWGIVACEIDTLGCRVPGHERYDGFYAKAESSIWERVQPPFDWLCGCSAVPIPMYSTLREPRKLIRKGGILDKWADRWSCNPLVKAIVYL